MKKILSAFFAAFLLASLCVLPAFAVSQARSVNATTTAETVSLVCEYCGQSDMICVDEYYASWQSASWASASLLPLRTACSRRAAFWW